MKKWIKKKTTEIFNSNIFSLKDIECYHPDKKITYDFYILDSCDWINVVALTENNEFLLVKQHRLGTDEITIETPAGLIEENEKPELTARRELIEETGYEPEEVFFLKKLSQNPAIISNYIYFYYAKNCKKIGEQNLDEAENIEVIKCSLDEVIEMLRNGKIHHSVAVNALGLYFMSEHNKSDIKIV
ncbi:NUDIX hydrolase [Spirochaetota bacterium]